MHRRLPATALLLGLVGLIPFVACALIALTSLDVARAGYALLALCGYGAVILSFVGGVHWGLVLGASEPPQGAVVDSAMPPRTRYRLVLGVLPSLGGWAAILVMFLGQTAVALAVLLVGFIAFTSAESELRQRGLVPRGYMVLRWGLSVAVVLILGTVLTLHLIGGRVSF